DAESLETKGLQAVLVSRSGTTSETVRAAEVLSQKYKVPTLGVTCTSPSPLSEACDLTLALPEANEESMVMTRSFTSLLLSMQLLAGRHGGHAEFFAALKAMAEHFASQINTLAARMRLFVFEHTFADYVFLGQGPF